MAKLEVGTLIYVRQSDAWPNQWHGIGTVVGHLPDDDYYVAKGDMRHDPRERHWDVMVSRALTYAVANDDPAGWLDPKGWARIHSAKKTATEE